MDDSFQISKIKNAFIAGAGHGIGLACVEHLLKNSDAHIYALYRKDHRAKLLKNLALQFSDRISPFKVEMTDEQELSRFISSELPSKLKLDLCLNCVGLLHDDSLSPEKSLRDIRSDALMESFKVNAVLTPLLGKYLRSYFDRKTPFIFASLSAMVGSLSDNSSGGWYAYRASKAALNMFIKNIGLEFKRSYPHGIVLAVHPGTTHTELSQPFSQNVKHQIWQPEETAAHLFSVFEGKTSKESGRFYNWNGEEIPW